MVLNPSGCLHLIASVKNAVRSVSTFFKVLRHNNICLKYDMPFNFFQLQHAPNVKFRNLYDQAHLKDIKMVFVHCN